MIFKTEPERHGFTSLHVTAILKNMRMSLFNQPPFMRPRYVLAGYSMPYSATSYALFSPNQNCNAAYLTTTVAELHLKCGLATSVTL